MPGMPEGVRTLCVAYDVEHYSGRGTQGEMAAQRRLVEALQAAFAEAGIGPGAPVLQEQGDGGIALLPTGAGVDEPRLLTGLLRGLATALAETNQDLVARARIRLRVGLSEGVVHRASHGYVGPAVIAACRLRDAEVVRSALAASSEADMVVVVTDGLYRDVLAHGYHGLPGSAFARITVEVKGFAGDAWLHVPGGARPRPPDTAGQAGASGADGGAGGGAGGGTLSELLGADDDMW